MIKLVDDFIKDLSKAKPEIFLYEGFGNCAYGSTLLHQFLIKEKVTNDILIGEFLLPSILGNKCKEVATSLMNKLPNDNSPYGIIKKGFDKRGGKLLSRIGHAVILIDKNIYDITSGQFGLPVFYTLEDFKKIWKDIYIAEVTLNKDPKTFNVEKITKKAFSLSYKHETFGFSNWCNKEI